MSELDQWCEIDGHEWTYSFMSHGFILGAKTEVMNSRCIKCYKSEVKHFVQAPAQPLTSLFKEILSW